VSFARVRSHLSFANAISSIALFLALGGGAYAASGGFVGAKGAIRVCVANGGGLTVVKSGRNCNKNTTAVTLDQRGQPGRAGANGAPGSQGVQGPQGVPGRSALQVLQTGETIGGAWASSGQVSGVVTVTGITFPIPAPQPVDSLHVVVQGNDSITGDGCTGTAAAPVSAPGFVCIYFAHYVNTTNADGYGARADLSILSSDSTTGDGSPYGFVLALKGTGNWYANGVWAYTAP
jgi:hypothetical protein